MYTRQVLNGSGRLTSPDRKRSFSAYSGKRFKKLSRKAYESAAVRASRERTWQAYCPEQVRQAYLSRQEEIVLSVLWEPLEEAEQEGV